jgi:hypothetical protein
MFTSFNIKISVTPITSKHTHPSYSETSRLLTSSLSLGVPVPEEPSVYETKYMDEEEGGDRERLESKG